MAGSDDRGLDLRLPWGRPVPAEPEPPATKRRSGAPKPRPAPEPPPSPARHIAPASDYAVEDEADHEEPSATAQPITAPFDLTDPRNAAFATRLDQRLERLELGLSARLDSLEQQAEAHEVGLGARLEQLEIQLNGANDASLEAVGMLAGQLIARLEEQVSGIERALQAWHGRVEEQVTGSELALEARHERLAAHLTAEMVKRHEELVQKVDSAHDATVEAMSGLASGPLVDRLLEGVVALGEVLDADLVNLRRLITEEHLGPSRPAALLHDFGDDVLDDPDELDEAGVRAGGLRSDAGDDEPLV